MLIYSFYLEEDISGNKADRVCSNMFLEYENKP